MKATNRTSMLRICAVVILAAIAGAFIQWHADQKEARASTWARFLLTLHDTNTGILEVKNGHSTIHYASPEAAAILGYNPNELEGQELTVILPKEMSLSHQVQMYYAMGLAQGDKLQTRVTAMVCKARRFDGSSIDVVIRLFMGRQTVMALINRADETKYLPPASSATDYHLLKEK